MCNAPHFIFVTSLQEVHLARKKTFLDTSKSPIFPAIFFIMQIKSLSGETDHKCLRFWYQICWNWWRNYRVVIIGINIWKITRKVHHSTVSKKWYLRRYVYCWMVTFAIFHLQTIFVQMIRTLVIDQPIPQIWYQN